MSKLILCDVCKKATTAVAFKLLISAPPSRGKAMHTDYTHHADVGICCQGRIKQIVKFKPRQKRADYNAERKKRSGMAKEIETAHKEEGKPKRGTTLGKSKQAA